VYTATTGWLWNRPSGGSVLDVARPEKRGHFKVWPNTAEAANPAGRRAVRHRGGWPARRRTAWVTSGRSSRTSTPLLPGRHVRKLLDAAGHVRRGTGFTVLLSQPNDTSVCWARRDAGFGGGRVCPPAVIALGSPIGSGARPQETAQHRAVEFVGGTQGRRVVPGVGAWTAAIPGTASAADVSRWSLAATRCFLATFVTGAHITWEPNSWPREMPAAVTVAAWPAWNGPGYRRGGGSQCLVTPGAECQRF